MTNEVLQWRWESKSSNWQPWDDNKDVVIRCAKDPEYGTGRVQERIKPADNEVTIERVAQ